MKRVFDPDEPELMDRPQPVSAELRKDLANLVALNRYFGSHGLIRRFLREWLAPDRCYRVADLATGAGDIPRLMVDWARTRGVTLRIDAVEANPATLEIAREAAADYPEISFIRGDARTFQSAESYDLVCCSLALHHFTEEDAVRVLQRCRELSHCCTLVTDLERSLATTAGVWAVTQFLFREPMTRHDGRVSAARAFSFSEMRALAEAAGWESFSHSRFLFCRQALWLDRRDLAPAADAVLSAPEGLPCPT